MKKYKNHRLFTLNNPLAPKLCPELAKEIGLNESLLFLQIEYWLATEGQERDDGHLWLRAPIREIQDTFVFWHPATVARTLASLTKLGLIVAADLDEGSGKSARWLRLDMDETGKLVSIRLSQSATTVVAGKVESVAGCDNRPYKEDQDHTEASEKKVPELPPCPPQSRAISQRGNGAARKPKEPPPETFPFPDRVEPTPELLEYCARHGYEGEDVRNSIESMRMKRLRDNKRYGSKEELGRDIQYWIMNCASNRDKRANANGGGW